MKKIKYQKPRFIKNKITIRYLTNRNSRFRDQSIYLAVETTSP